MELNFTPEEIIYIYGRFKEELKELETLKSAPNRIVDNGGIKLCKSITEKIEAEYPQVSKLPL
ncbi:hypothetical protein [Faecalispora anaeroviscerum]|uniref:hypothetical protein n=1 Tax=Faecalispora anaeroviscerum TaxID=2991836 RepID=UPI0024BB151A|nr:hypothetical protein [Faecalispora anaeroviscerum]